MSDLQDKILEHQAKEMQSSIDWEIKAGMLEELGWVRVEILSDSVEEHLRMLVWVNEHSQHDVKNRHDVFLFQDEEDAIMFKLKWA